MNIYFTDDEMRKQAEQLLNALVTTGQESPETDRRMRNLKNETKAQIDAPILDGPNKR